MHLYPRISHSFNIGLSLGVGKALDNNYSILLGPSMLIGNQNRIALSGGWNFSNIKALSNSEYDSTGKLIQLPSTTTTVSYYNTFKTGYFFSLSYSFGTSSSGSQSAAVGTSSVANASGAGSSAQSGGGGTGGSGLGGGANGGGH